MAATLTSSGITFSNGSVQSRPVVATFDTVANPAASNNVAIYNSTGKMIMFNAAFYHNWQQSSDDSYLYISPDNANWYIAARQSTVTCGQGGANTYSCLVPAGWYVKPYHNRGWLQYLYYQY